MNSHNILLVDDEQNILRSLRRELVAEGYLVFIAQSGEEGLKMLEDMTVHVIISDQSMPGMSGIEFLERTVENNPDAIRIILTGHAELSDAIRAVNNGCVYKFIIKPWNSEELKVTIRRSLEQYDLLLKNKDLTMELKKRDRILEELEKKNPGITQRPKDGIYEIKSEE